MKLILQFVLYSCIFLFAIGCSDHLVYNDDEDIIAETRVNVQESDIQLILGRAPYPAAESDWFDMQLLITRTLPQGLHVQVSVRPKTNQLGYELAGSDYYLPAGERYVNIKLPAAYATDRLPVVAKIKYLTYNGSEDIFYSTATYLVTYDYNTITYKVISDNGFVNYKNPITPPKPPIHIDPPIRPLDPPGLPIQ